MTTEELNVKVQKSLDDAISGWRSEKKRADEAEARAKAWEAALPKHREVWEKARKTWQDRAEAAEATLRTMTQEHAEVLKEVNERVWQYKTKAEAAEAEVEKWKNAMGEWKERANAAVEHAEVRVWVLSSCISCIWLYKKGLVISKTIGREWGQSTASVEELESDARRDIIHELHGDEKVAFLKAHPLPTETPKAKCTCGREIEDHISRQPCQGHSVAESEPPTPSPKVETPTQVVYGLQFESDAVAGEFERCIEKLMGGCNSVTLTALDLKGR